MGRSAATSEAGTVTYHQTFTVEATARKFRLRFLNQDASAMTILSVAIAASKRLGTGAQQYTPTEAYKAVTFSGAAGVVVPGGSSTLLGGVWSDWIDYDTVAPDDGTNLPVMMLRAVVAAGMHTHSYYSFTPWASPSNFNNGRFLYTFRGDGDFIASPGSFPGTVYDTPFVMGFEYECLTTKKAVTFAAFGNSATEGAVQSGLGNFGNAWEWMTVSALRNANPDVIIGYVNHGVSSSTSGLWYVRLQDYVNDGGKVDAFIYPTFTSNDGTPSPAGNTALQANTALAWGVIDPTEKPAIYWPGIPNTGFAWDATTDGYRLDQRAWTLALAPGRMVADVEALIGTGATPNRLIPAYTTDNTHPNEAGYAAMVPGFQPGMQAIINLYKTATAPVNTVGPVLSGSANVGEVLSVSTGTWTSLLGTARITYQWLRNGTPIVGATGTTYSIVPSDAGATISVAVTATNLIGSTTVAIAGSGAVGAAINPTVLFQSSERGLWIDASDPATLRQTNTGTAVTADGQTDGLALSKSHWGNLPMASVLGANIDTNGDFSGGIGTWTDASTAPGSIAVVSNALNVIHGGSGGIGRARNTYTVVVGKRYRFIVSASGGGPAAQLGTVAAGVQYGTATPGTEFFFEATTTTLHVQLVNTTSGTTSIYDNIFIQEVPGVHARQATAGLRPLYRSAGYIDHDGVDDLLVANFVTSMGSACTVAYVTASGVTILTAQTIGTTFNLPAADWYQMVVINRALTGTETTNLTAWMRGKAGI
jgi:lysophospholipase L1-like esterase